FLDNSGDLGCFKRTRRGDRLKSLRRKGLYLRSDGRGRNRQRSFRLEGRMRDTPDVPQLQHDVAAGHVHRFRHAFPTLDLLLAMNSGRRDVTLTLWHDLCRFRNNQTGAGALGIIKSIQLGRHIAGSGTATRERRHGDTIRKPQRPNFDGAKEINGGTCLTFLHCAFSTRRTCWPTLVCSEWRGKPEQTGIFWYFATYLLPNPPAAIGTNRIN